MKASFKDRSPPAEKLPTLGALLPECVMVNSDPEPVEIDTVRIGAL